MEVTVVVAVIAASVSLAATVANVLIAAKTRKATFALQRDAAALRLAEERAARLRLQATEAERLRIECLLLRTSVETAMLEEWQEGRVAIDAAADRFRSAFEQFWRQWADTKGDIPRGDVILIRTVRHEINTPIGYLIVDLQRLGRADTRLSAQRHLPQVFRNLDRVSQILDRFFALITDTQMKAANFGGA
jgi:signal transduction histidine kinase